MLCCCSRLTTIPWLLAAAAAAAQFLAPASWIEAVWVRYAYRPLATALVPLSGTLPVSLSELLVVLVVVLVTLRMRARWRRSRGSARWRRVLACLHPILTTALLAYATFAWIWGLNYSRVPLEQRAGLIHRPPLPEEVDRLAEETVGRLNALVTRAHRETAAHAESAASHALAGAAASIDGFRPTVPRRIKRVFPPGLLTRFGVVGVTSPWLLEGHIDPSILKIERPFTAAHESAHVAGFAPEGDASFVAILACRTSGSPLAEYSAELDLLGQILARFSRRRRSDLLARLAPAVRTDLTGIRRRARRERWEPAAHLQRRLYETYLHAQKVERGLADYGRVIDLLLAWEHSGSRRGEAR